MFTEHNKILSTIKLISRDIKMFTEHNKINIKGYKNVY